jgi:hypothetical protein
VKPYVEAVFEFLGHGLEAVLLFIVVLSFEQLIAHQHQATVVPWALNHLRERLGMPAVSLRPEVSGFMVK